jgi:hypothetical protein
MSSSSAEPKIGTRIDEYSSAGACFFSAASGTLTRSSSDVRSTTFRYSTYDTSPNASQPPPTYTAASWNANTLSHASPLTTAASTAGSGSCPPPTLTLSGTRYGRSIPGSR